MMRCKYCGKAYKSDVCNICNVKYDMPIKRFGIEPMLKNISRITNSKIINERQMMNAIRSLEER